MIKLRFVISALAFGFVLGIEVSSFFLVRPSMANTEKALKVARSWQENSNLFERAFNQANENTKNAMRASDTFERAGNSCIASLRSSVATLRRVGGLPPLEQSKR